MYVQEEWHVRRIVMDATLTILADGQSYTARELLKQLNAHGITVPKKLVNSVLFRPTKENNYTYNASVSGLISTNHFSRPSRRTKRCSRRRISL